MSAEIAAGSAVRHRRFPRTMLGRVRRILNGRALVTWVRRMNPSFARLENLEPISECELASYFNDQELFYERLGQEEREFDMAPPARTSAENRLFLLEGLSSELMPARTTT